MSDDTPMMPSRDIARLIAIMAALRTPVSGCPWDLEQSFATIAPYTIEEAYEVADAIARGDMADLREELGDLLLQVVYHARLAEETGAFAFGDVVEGITAKMIRRHPHVFGDAEARTVGVAKGFWERIKAEEKAAKAAARAAMGGAGSGLLGAEGPSVLADVPVALPALTRAVKLQERAARVGFDWPSLGPVLDKMREELAELEAVVHAADPGGSAAAAAAPPVAATGDAAVGSGAATKRAEGGGAGAAGDAARRLIEEELGDLLFVMANVARHLAIDPEAALNGANQKFRRRFAHIEARLAEGGRSPAQSDLAEMDRLWDEAKAVERRQQE